MYKGNNEGTNKQGPRGRGAYKYIHMLKEKEKEKELLARDCHKLPD